MSSSIASASGPETVPLAFVDGLGELAGRFDLILCDVWGVLHDGVKAFPAAGDALARYRAAGGTVILVSNAPRPGPVVMRHLDQLGVTRDAYDDVRTSGDLTRAIAGSYGDRPFHHIGPERDLGLFKGLTGRPTPIEEADYVVCTGLVDDEIEVVEDYADRLADMRARDLPMICANPDLVVERGHRLILCAGALGAAYEEMGGRTITPGKPHLPIYEAALTLGAELVERPLALDRVLAVGDAIRTDIAGGHAAGLATLLVARGIHAGELLTQGGDLDRARAEAWVRHQSYRPTMVTRELVWDTTA